MQFSEKKVGETITLGFDLVRVLGSGETISNAVFSSEPTSGTDAAAGSMISGAAVVAGSVVKQRIVDGVAGVYYRISATVTTNQGNVLIERGSLGVIE